MLISFTVENWMSFKNKSSISAVASRQSTYRERLPYLKKYDTRVLPIIAIYGGNASGKSNLIYAVHFAKEFIKDGTKNQNSTIDAEPFLLCKEKTKQPCRFWFEFVLSEQIYEYYFSVTNTEVIEERLTKLDKLSEHILFERDKKGIKIIEKIKSSNEKKVLDFVSQITRKNQLYLTSLILSNNNRYKEIYDWFSDNIRVIGPSTKYIAPQYIADSNDPSYQDANSLLNNLDTGISYLDTEPLHGINIKEIKENYESISDYIEWLEDETSERYIHSTEDGKDVIKRIVSYHECEDGTKMRFALSQESDGTRRLIELIPAFLVEDDDESMSWGDYIIDEIDESLHHMLIRKLIENYLNSCNESTRVQIIFTTHDLLLLDQDLFRRDEMYLTERNHYGETTIIPISDYSGIRQDKDILKSYLQGRFGGIPRL